MKSCNSDKIGLYFNPMHYPSNSGVMKKVFSQLNAFRQEGIAMDYAGIDLNSKMAEYIVTFNGEHINKIRKGFFGKIESKLNLFTSLWALIKERKYNFIYIRYNNAMDISLMRFIHSLKKSGIKIITELPTFPYDGERNLSLRSITDILFRKFSARYFDYIVTFSQYHHIWKRPTVRISNGVDFNSVPLRKKNITILENKPFVMIAVAQISFWHGIDRLIKGMAQYRHLAAKEVLLYIFSGVDSEEIVNLKRLVEDLNLEKCVFFEGFKTGDELDECFEMADLAIGSLGRHRNGIKSLKTLKNVEYAARGIPFIYSEENEDFDEREYVMRVPADESPIDIQQCVDFIASNRFTPQEIRDSIKYLDWKSQIKKIIDECSI